MGSVPFLQPELATPDATSDARSPLERPPARRFQLCAVPARLRVGFLFILLLAVLAIIVPPAFGLNPYRMDPSAVLRGPSLRYLFGTDDYGRNLFARVLYGLRTSFAVGLLVSALTGAIGLIVAVAVVRVRLLGAVVMRFVDVLMALPAVVMALALVTVIGPGFSEVILVEVLFFIPWSIRIMRASMLSVESVAFVEAATAQGATGWWIVRKHILPNAAAPMVVQQVLIFGYAILAEAVLSFLGVGIEAPAASLGNLLSEAQPVMLQDPLFSVFPGVLIAITVLAVNLMADGAAEFLRVERRGVAN